MPKGDSGTACDENLEPMVERDLKDCLPSRPSCKLLLLIASINRLLILKHCLGDTIHINITSTLMEIRMKLYHTKLRSYKVLS